MDIQAGFQQRQPGCEPSNAAADDGDGQAVTSHPKTPSVLMQPILSGFNIHFTYQLSNSKEVKY
jgi:hypothetical protein